MVDIGGKPVTARRAVAQAYIHMSQDALSAIRENSLVKGDALGAARIAGIMAAKRVDELIPLCHSLPLSAATVDFTVEEDGVRVTASASTTAQTGVEMEALTAASIAALTVYDMCKSIDKRISIDEIRLVQKTGGKSGDFDWDPSE